MCQNNNAKQDKNDDVVWRQIDFNWGLSAHTRKSKDPALDAINTTTASWKRYFTQLPWIAALARKFLSLVVTSAVAERVFKSAELIVAAMFYVGPTPCKKAYFYT